MWVCLNLGLSAYPEWEWAKDQENQECWRRTPLWSGLRSLLPQRPPEYRNSELHTFLIWSSGFQVPQSWRYLCRTVVQEIVLGRIRLFVVCYYNPLALWEILYGSLSSLTGLFHCAFVIVINAEVLPEVWLRSQPVQHGLIFSLNKQSSLYALSYPKMPL